MSSTDSPLIGEYFTYRDKDIIYRLTGRYMSMLDVMTYQFEAINSVGYYDKRLHLNKNQMKRHLKPLDSILVRVLYEK